MSKQTIFMIGKTQQNTIIENIGHSPCSIFGIVLPAFEIVSAKIQYCESAPQAQTGIVVCERKDADRAAIRQ
jgi:hypothetical protein